VGKPVGKWPCGRLKWSWENNAELDVREVFYDGLN
jgi:hypothetical protein